MTLLAFVKVLYKFEKWHVQRFHQSVRWWEGKCPRERGFNTMVQELREWERDAGKEGLVLVKKRGRASGSMCRRNAIRGCERRGEIEEDREASSLHGPLTSTPWKSTPESHLLIQESHKPPSLSLFHRLPDFVLYVPCNVHHLQVYKKNTPMLMMASLHDVLLVTTRIHSSQPLSPNRPLYIHVTSS